MRLRAANDMAFIRPEAQPTETESGLSIVFENQQSTIKGEVIALGPGRYTTRGIRIPHSVTVGDRVIFSREDGEEVEFEQETLICMREGDILAIIQE